MNATMPTSPHRQGGYRRPTRIISRARKTMMLVCMMWLSQDGKTVSISRGSTSSRSIIHRHQNVTPTNCQNDEHSHCQSAHGRTHTRPLLGSPLCVPPSITYRCDREHYGGEHVVLDLAQCRGLLRYLLCVRPAHIVHGAQTEVQRLRDLEGKNHY